MRKIKILALIGLLAGSLAVLSACGQAIGTPDMEKFVIDKTNKLSWTAVSGARYYIIQITDVDTGEVKEVTAKRTNHSLSTLTEGDYEIRIKAVAGDKDKEDSEWSDICYFKKGYESGCIYRLVNNMEYEITDVGSATGDVRIESTYRDKPVTSIADSAFRGEKGITSVTIGEGITYIGRSAFNNCPNIVSVTLPSTLETLGKAAFQSCRSLKSIVIPNSLTVLEEYTFAYCRELATVTLGEALTTVGPSAFMDCSALLEVTIPDSVTFVGDRAFLGNSLMTSVHIGEGVKTIDNYAFSDCKVLSKIEFAKESQLKTLGEEVFYSCMELETIQLPEGLQTIGKKTFNLCTKLDEINIPDSVTSIKDSAFINTKFYKEAVENKQLFVYVDNWVIGCTDKNQLLTDENGAEKGWAITADSFDREVVGLGDSVFSQSRTLETVTLPSTIKYLGYEAFANCQQLYTVNLANTQIERIGERAFYRCGLLKTVNMKKPNGTSPIKTIGKYAFAYCSSLVNSAISGASMIPDSVTTIERDAFRGSGLWKNPVDGVVYAGNWVVGYNAEGLTEVSIRAKTIGIADCAFLDCETLKTISGLSTVEYIGAAAFERCSSLERVVLNTDLKVIKENTFRNCVSLYDVTLPIRLTTIEQYAFQGCEKLNAIDFSKTKLTALNKRAFYRCTNLEKVVLGNALETIGAEAFYKCLVLKEVRIPDTVTEMGERAFGGCEKLEKITIGSGLTDISEGAFRNSKALKEIVIPENIQSIGAYAFYKCENIESVTIEHGVQSIGDYAFYGVENMQRLSLPNSVKSIGMYAFKGCNYLQSIVLGDNIEEIGKFAFHGCKQMTVYTSANSLPEGWHTRWNSSYRPVIWGCEISEEGYVVSVTIGEDTIYNKNIENVIATPKRAGYTFDGWSATVDGVEVVYKANEIANAPVGVTLTAIWTEGDEPLIEIPEEDSSIKETSSITASTSNGAAV
jgi:uncharacterized repeat protein (TIGR02543 family)